ncbi:MAG: hypothetical protein V4481_05675 [Patescibacteria group bacterium]
MDDEKKESGGGNEAIYVIVGFLALIAIAPFVLSTLHPDAIPFVSYFMAHWDGYVAGIKKLIDWIVGISFPISIILFIMIIYCVERLKEIRKLEKSKMEAKVEQAYEPVNPGGDPGMAKRWNTVMTHIESDNPNDWKQAILEADIMLDDLLENLGYRGNTIGDKLKRVDSAHFLTLQDAWDAHTVRNKIAHEGSSFELNQMEAQAVIKQYKKVFEEFYFI